MRPVNLIPPDERRGEGAPARTGSLSWIVVGVLAVAVLGVGMAALASKQVSDKEAELAGLEQQEAEVAERAASLEPFTTFQQVTDARVQTVAALAESRFDWQRVMEELARVIPPQVWLTRLAGEANQESGSGSEFGGPSLTFSGCARSHRGVARMVAAIDDIDGVTRVSATRSEKSDTESTSSGGPGSDCRTRSFVTEFELVAVFDEVAVPEGAVPPADGSAPAPGAPPPAGGTPAEPATGGEATPTSSGDDVGDAQQARSEQSANVAKAEDKARNSTATFIPGGGG